MYFFSFIINNSILFITYFMFQLPSATITNKKKFDFCQTLVKRYLEKYALHIFSIAFLSTFKLGHKKHYQPFS